MKINKKSVIITTVSAILVAAIGLGIFAITAKGDDGKKRRSHHNSENNRIDESTYVLPRNKDNIFGLDEAIVCHNTLILIFDNEKLLENSENNIYGFSTLYYNADSPEAMPTIKFYIASENGKGINNEYLPFDNDKVKVANNGTKTTLTFETSESNLDNLTKLSFAIFGNFTEINFKTSTLSFQLEGGDCATIYTQHYDKRAKSWGEVEKTLKLYEECYE